MIKFTKNELKVLKHLDYEPISVAELVNKSHMPRMTVYTTLLRLRSNGIVKSVNKSESKRLLWQKNDTNKLTHELTKHIKDLFGYDLNINTIGDHISPLNGKDQIANMLMELTKKNYNKRVYTMQSSSNFPVWVKVFGKSWANKHNKLLVDNNVIVFSIYSKNIPQSILEDKEIIENYKGRKGNSMAIDDKYFITGVALYIFDGQILIVDIHNLEAVMISNKSFISFFIKIFEYIFESADRDKLYFEYGK